jgi:hypothetical protein
MDSLKDVVDTVITINKKDGYAYVKVWDQSRWCDRPTRW